MGWLVAVSIAGCLGLLYADGRRHEQAVRRDWQVLLTPRARRALEEVGERINDELALADLALGRAFELRKQDAPGEALEVLQAGSGLVQRFAPDMGTFLAGLSVFSRMVPTMVPVRPLHPRTFAVGRLCRMARANQALHLFLVTTHERFRLRLSMLRRGFVLAGRALSQAEERLRLRGGCGDADWDSVEAARRDLHALSTESLDSFRDLLLSLSAERKGTVAVELPDHRAP